MPRVQPRVQPVQSSSCSNYCITFGALLLSPYIARPGNALETFVRGKSSMPTATSGLAKNRGLGGTYSVFGSICPPPLTMLGPSSNSHWTKRTRVA